LREWFTQALGNADYAQQLAELCERLEFHQGDIVASQGDPADCMHFILEGRVGVIVKFDDGRSIRVRSLGPHTTIGEMGLITRQARSATIQAEGESVLYALSIDAFERIGRESRPLSQALPTYVITVMAERLLRQQGDRRFAALRDGEPTCGHARNATRKNERRETVVVCVGSTQGSPGGMRGAEQFPAQL
jgi:CRP-like cAMP-binding protein